MSPRCRAVHQTLLAITILAAPIVAGGQSRGAQTATMERLQLPALIGDPAFFAGGASGFVLVDYSTMAIYRADAGGKWMDSLVARGSGPGEFRDISGVGLSADGGIWVTDGGNARMTRLSTRLRVVEEVRTDEPLRWPVPRGSAQPQLLAIPSSVQHLAVLVQSTGQTLRRVPFPPTVESLNPIIRERYLIRISDSMSVVQFRWMDRRIALRENGSIMFDSGNDAVKPEVLAIALDRGGSTAYRVDPKARPFALSVAAQANTLLVLRGGDEAEHGRTIARYDAASGRYLGSFQLPLRTERIAVSGRLLLAIVETDDGFGVYRVVQPR